MVRMVPGVVLQHSIHWRPSQECFTIPQNHDATIALDAEATRLGTRALLCNALVSLVANIIMPYFVASQHARHPASPLQPRPKTWLERVQIPLASLWALSHFLFAFCMLATLYVDHDQR